MQSGKGYTKNSIPVSGFQGTQGASAGVNNFEESSSLNQINQKPKINPSNEQLLMIPKPQVKRGRQNSVGLDSYGANSTGQSAGNFNNDQDLTPNHSLNLISQPSGQKRLNNNRRLVQTKNQDEFQVGVNQNNAFSSGVRNASFGGAVIQNNDLNPLSRNETNQFKSQLNFTKKQTVNIDNSITSPLKRPSQYRESQQIQIQSAVKNLYGLPQNNNSDVISVGGGSDIYKFSKKQQNGGNSSVGNSNENRQTSAASDFMNRFKGKISTVNKDGNFGIVEQASQPIYKINMNNQQINNQPIINKPDFNSPLDDIGVSGRVSNTEAKRNVSVRGFTNFETQESNGKKNNINQQDVYQQSYQIYNNSDQKNQSLKGHIQSTERKPQLYQAPRMSDQGLNNQIGTQRSNLQKNGQWSDQLNKQFNGYGYSSDQKVQRGSLQIELQSQKIPIRQDSISKTGKQLNSNYQNQQLNLSTIDSGIKRINSDVIGVNPMPQIRNSPTMVNIPDSTYGQGSSPSFVARKNTLHQALENQNSAKRPSVYRRIQDYQQADEFNKQVNINQTNGSNFIDQNLQNTYGIQNQYKSDKSAGNDLIKMNSVNLNKNQSNRQDSIQFNNNFLSSDGSRNFSYNQIKNDGRQIEQTFMKDQQFGVIRPNQIALQQSQSQVLSANKTQTETKSFSGSMVQASINAQRRHKTPSENTPNFNNLGYSKVETKYHKQDSAKRQKEPSNYGDATSMHSGSFPSISKPIPPTSLMTVHNDRQLFQNMPGLGPVNVGTEEWNIAKVKQQRMSNYVNNLKSKV